MLSANCRGVPSVQGPRNEYSMGRKKPRQSRPPADIPPPPVPRVLPSWVKHLVFGIAIGAVTLLAYSNSFHTGFVLDNRYLILRDPRIHAATSDNVRLILDRTYWWPTSETGLYRPVSTFSYLFNYAILGNAEKPEGYHVINFLLHYLNVLLVYALALRILKKFWPAVFIAALWAVHPVLTESVTNIIGRSDLLSAAAVLSGLLMYLRSTDFTDWRRYTWLAGLMAVTAVGAFSKESSVTILGVIVLYETSFWKERKQLRGLEGGCVAVAIPIAVMLYERAKVLAASAPPQFSFVDNPMRGAHFLASRLTAVVVMAKYLWILLWPASLSADYSYSQIAIASGTFQEWVAWIAVSAVIVAVAWQFTRNRLYFFFGAFAFVTILPVTNLLFLTGTIMAERFLYLPSIGFAACAVMLVYDLSEKLRLRIVAPVALSVIIVAMGVRTWIRNVDWYDSLTLALASVKTSPQSFKTHLGVAIELVLADPSHPDISRVIEETDKFLAILDSLPDSLNISSAYASAGGNYTLKGDSLVTKTADGKRLVTPESIEAYHKSLQILTRGVDIDRTAAEIYRQQKIASGKPVTQISPAGLPLLYTNLATVQLRLGNIQQAFDAAVYARLLNPNIVEPYILMAQTLAPQNRKEEAALALVEGILVSGEQGLMGPLAVLYKYGVDPEGCAISHNANGPFLNNACPKVHKEICEGSAELIGLYQQNFRPDLEATARSRATEQYGCTAAELEKH
jgi:tetratricopeptide (TPR) repeat protein